MTGRKIALGKGAKVRDGKIVVLAHFRDASHAIRAKKSKKTKPVRRKPSHD